MQIVVLENLRRGGKENKSHKGSVVCKAWASNRGSRQLPEPSQKPSRHWGQQGRGPAREGNHLLSTLLASVSLTRDLLM